MFGDTNIVIINELSNTLAFFISIIFHLRNLSNLYITRNLQINRHRNLLFPAPVACLGVDEEVSDVCLVLLVIVGQAGNDGSVEVPGVFVIRNQYLDSVGAFCLHREERAHQSGADSSGGMGDLEFQDEVEMFDPSVWAKGRQVGCDGRSAGVRGDIRTECNEQIFLDDCCIVEGD